MRNNEVRPSGFIVGMSRSGTKWLSMCLNEHSEIAVFGETGFWGKDYIPTEDGRWTPQQCRAVLERMPGIRERRIDEHGRVHVEGQATPVGETVGGLNGLFFSLAEEIVSDGDSLSPEEVFNRICSIVASDSGKNRVFEKTPHHINWIRRIHATYPNARFIVMCRDPYGFMRSYKHQGDRKTQAIGAAYRKIYHPIGCALVYRGYARAILDAQSFFPENMLLISLDAIKHDASSSLATIFHFLGVSYEEDCLLPPLNSSFPERTKELDDVDVLWMNWIAGREIQRLGYEKRKSNVSVSKLLQTIAEVPRWGVNVWNHLKRNQNASVAKYILRWLR